MYLDVLDVLPLRLVSSFRLSSDCALNILGFLGFGGRGRSTESGSLCGLVDDVVAMVGGASTE